METGLKRSSSAPTGLNFVGLSLGPSTSYENQLSDEASVKRASFLPATRASHRRNSANVGATLAPDAAKKLAGRLQFLRKEGSVRNCIENDYAGERFFRSAAQISSGWNDLQIVEDLSPVHAVEERKRAKSVCEPVHVFTNFLPASCSPSPTRNEKQCYSPSMQQVVRKACFSPSPSPSPTRRSFLRSLSPIAVRQQGCLKRKIYENDSDAGLAAGSIKRAAYTPPVPVQNDREPPRFLPVFNVSFNHSLSVSSMDSESSSNSPCCGEFAGSLAERNSTAASSFALPADVALFEPPAASTSDSADSVRSSVD